MQGSQGDAVAWEEWKCFFLSDDDSFLIKTMSQKGCSVAEHRKHLGCMAESCLLHRALREMPSPGKSGSVFFLSDDDRFIIKTVSHEEMLLLLKLIPAYYVHCAENPTTLLTRFFGVHRIKPLGSQSKVRLPCEREMSLRSCMEFQLRRPVAVAASLAGSQKTRGGAILPCWVHCVLTRRVSHLFIPRKWMTT